MHLSHVLIWVTVYCDCGPGLGMPVAHCNYMCTEGECGTVDGMAFCIPQTCTVYVYTMYACIYIVYVYVHLFMYLAG